MGGSHWRHTCGITHFTADKPQNMTTLKEDINKFGNN